MAATDYPADYPAPPVREPYRDTRHDARLRRLDHVAGLLDSALGIPGTPIRFGWDSVLGLVPVAGDTLALLPAAWIMIEGYRLGLRKRALAQMMMNTGLDWALGSVPLLGDIFDVGWKANLRNVALIRREIDRHPQRTAPRRERNG